MTMPSDRKIEFSTTPFPGVRWYDFVVPTKYLPDAGIGWWASTGGVVMRGRRFGLDNRYTVLHGASQAGIGEVYLGKPVDSLEFHAHEGVTDDIDAISPKFAYQVKNHAWFERSSTQACRILQVKTTYEGGLTQDTFLYIYSQSPIVSFEVALTWSDRKDPRWLKKIGTPVFMCRERFHIDFADAHGWEQPRKADSGDAWVSTLNGIDMIGDGEQIIVQGRMLCSPISMMHLALRRQNWEKPAYAVCITPGVASELLPGAWNFDRTWFPRDISVPTHAVGYEAGRRYAMAAHAGQSGEHQDFGWCRGIQDGLATPRNIHKLSYHLHTPLRGMHHTDEMGWQLYAKDVPGWVTYNGQTDFRLARNTLGKSDPKDWATRHGAFGHSPMDEEHQSTNYEAGYLSLTGSKVLEQGWQMMREVDKAVAMPRPGAARALGRTLVRFSQMLWLLGDDEKLREIADEKVSLAMKEIGDSRMVVMGSYRSPWRFDGRPHWQPWEEAVLVMGCMQYAAVTNNAEAKVLGLTVASTIVSNAFLRDDGTYRVASAVERNEDRLWLPEELADHTIVNLDFSRQTLPAAIVAWQEDGNQKALDILRTLRPKGPENYDDAAYLSIAKEPWWE